MIFRLLFSDVVGMFDSTPMAVYKDFDNPADLSDATYQLICDGLPRDYERNGFMFNAKDDGWLCPTVGGKCAGGDADARVCVQVNYNDGLALHINWGDVDGVRDMMDHSDYDLSASAMLFDHDPKRADLADEIKRQVLDLCMADAE